MWDLGQKSSCLPGEVSRDSEEHRMLVLVLWGTYWVMNEISQNQGGTVSFFSSEVIPHRSLARLHPTEILIELFSFINYYWDWLRVNNTDYGLTVSVPDARRSSRHETAQLLPRGVPLQRVFGAWSRGLCTWPLGWEDPLSRRKAVWNWDPIHVTRDKRAEMGGGGKEGRTFQ